MVVGRGGGGGEQGPGYEFYFYKKTDREQFISTSHFNIFQLLG